MLRPGTGRVVVVCLLALIIAGCARIERQPVPAPLVAHATVPGLANARFWGDEVPKDVVAFVQPHIHLDKALLELSLINLLALRRHGRKHVI